MVAWRFLKQYCLRAWWSCAFSSGFRPWPLRTKISPDSSQYYELWMVKDLNSLHFCIEKHCLWTDCAKLHERIVMKWWTMTHPCLQRLSLWWMLILYSILITSPVTNKTANCGTFQNNVTCNFFTLMWVCCRRHSSFLYSQNTIWFVSENTKSSNCTYQSNIFFVQVI